MARLEDAGLKGRGYKRRGIRALRGLYRTVWFRGLGKMQIASPLKRFGMTVLFLFGSR